MGKVRRSILVVAIPGLVLVGLVGSPSRSFAAPPDPPIRIPHTGCYIGAYVATEAAGMASFNTHAGKPQALFLRFVTVGQDSFETSGADLRHFCDGCYDLGALPYLTLEPWHATSSSLLTPADLVWLDRFARECGKLRGPVFIRFGHEMNGNWYPWGWTYVSTATYRAGFQTVAQSFRAHAPRAALVWAPSNNWGTNADDAYSSWYPGDSYVDWVGLTTYQWPYSGLAANQFAESILYGDGAEGDFYATFAEGHHKPMMVAETACGDDFSDYYDNVCYGPITDETGTYGTGVGQGAQQWWIKQVYKLGSSYPALDHTFPMIKAIVWFGPPSGPEERDFNIGGYDLTQHSTGFAAYSAAVAPSYWQSDALPAMTTTAVAPAAPDGSNGWYVTTPTVSFTATEPATFMSEWDATSPAGFVAGATTHPPADGSHTAYYFSVDSAGNTETAQSLSLKLDANAPRIDVGGVADGMAYDHDVAPTFSATDPPPASGVATSSGRLDGSLFASGTTVTVGAHLLSVTATDKAGNHSSRGVSFVVYETTPSTALVTVPAAPNGTYGWYRTIPAIGLHASGGLPPVTTRYAWDGAPATAYAATFTAPPGVHSLAYWSVGGAGNTEDTHSAVFSVDATRPLLQVQGVQGGRTYDHDVAPTFDATDPVPGSGVTTIAATLDGHPFGSGDTAGEGSHTLVVDATDTAGNTEATTVAFTVDKTPPQAHVSGVTGGAVYRHDVHPAFDATDPAPGSGVASVTATLEGAPFSSGSTVSVEGSHTLIAMATDRAGNASSLAVDFAIDKTPPMVSISGVQDGAFYYHLPVSPSFDATDPPPGSGVATVSATLNGEPFSPGDAVSTEGTCTLTAAATDTAGNAASITRRFVLDLHPPEATATATPDTPDGQDGWYRTRPTVRLTADETSTLFSQWDATLVAGFAAGTSTVVPGDGVHTLHYFAIDSRQNTGTVRTLSFKVDATPPTAPALDSPTHPEAGRAYSKRDAVFDWSAEDTASGISAYRWVLDREPLTLPDETGEGAGTTTCCAGLADGTWYFHARASDAAGNWGPASHRTVRVDTSTDLGLDALSPIVAWSKQASLGGRLLSAADGPLSGRSIEIQERAPRAVAFKTTATTLTNAAGGFSAAVKPVGNTRYRARFAGDATYGDSISALADVQVRAAVSLRVTPALVRRAGWIAIRGIVRPSQPDRYVLIFKKKEAGKWARLGTVRLSASSSASARWRLKGLGTYYYKAYFPGGQASLSGWSAPVRVRVSAMSVAAR